jgi:GTP-binding protein HflX
MVSQRRVAGSEVDRVETPRREVGDVRPRLFRANHEVARSLQGTHRRRVHYDGSRLGVTDNVERRAVGYETHEIRLCLCGRPVGRVAEVERGARLSRDHVVCNAGVEPCHGDDLAELETADDRHARLELEEGPEPVDGTLEGAVGEPRSRGVAARPREHEPRNDVAEASGLELEVRRLEHDCKRCVANRVRALEQRRQRVVLGCELLSSEQQQTQIACRRSGIDVPRELDGDGQATLHVARAEAVDLAVGDASWDVPLRRNRVVVGGEHDQRTAGTSRRNEEVHLVPGVFRRPVGRHEPEYVLPDRFLVTALRGDVDELERPRGEAVGERGHRGSVPRHNHAVTARQPDPAPGAEPERGYLVGVYPKGADGAEELAELVELARTAGVAPIGSLVQHRAHSDPRTFVGKGKLIELTAEFGSSDAEVLLTDEELTPTQQRALEDALKTRVVDRTQLILDIFAQHARSAEGKLQVELAQLEYNLPRMRGMWQHLERLGGGVGTRGPGESQLETDRRLARTRVSLLKRRLRTLEGQRSTRRKKRLRTSTPTIALAGYTNVGKSTLLNALTGAHASVDDRLFETLDPTTRGFEHDGKRYLVTDTVGFIRRLPTQLVEGFAATLEETLVADLVLHVADASLPEDRLTETIAAVNAVLAEIGADDIPAELVLNKADLLDPLARRRVEHVYPRALLVSASTGEGLDALQGRIAELFSDRFEDVRLLVPYADGRALADLYDLGAPIAERRDTPEGVRIRARLPRAEAARFARYLVADERDGELDRASAR